MKVKALKQLTFKTTKGKVTVKPGQVFKPANPEKLIKAGLAEPVTDQVGKVFWRSSDGSCYICNSRESWTSIHGVIVCSRCHPSPDEKLVAYRYGTA